MAAVETSVEALRLIESVGIVEAEDQSGEVVPEVKTLAQDLTEDTEGARMEAGCLSRTCAKSWKQSRGNLN